MCPSRLCAQVPGRKTCEWKSSGHPLASTVAACAPEIVQATLESLTSKSAPPAAFKPAREDSKSPGCAPLRETRSHEPGPSHSAVTVSLFAVVFGSTGNETPKRI